MLQYHSLEVFNWVPTIEELVHCVNAPRGISDNPTIVHLKFCFHQNQFFHKCKLQVHLSAKK